MRVPAGRGQRYLHFRLFDVDIAHATGVPVRGSHAAQFVYGSFVPTDVQRVLRVRRTGETDARVREVPVHAYGHNVTGLHRCGQTVRHINKIS